MAEVKAAILRALAVANLTEPSRCRYNGHLVANVAGGVSFVTALNHAQVVAGNARETCNGLPPAFAKLSLQPRNLGPLQAQVVHETLLAEHEPDDRLIDCR
jgi:hypothetical protein